MALPISIDTLIKQQIVENTRCIFITNEVFSEVECSFTTLP